MKELVIDRTYWNNAGNGIGIVSLLNSAGYMCCLGFACLADGLKESEILDMSVPVRFSVESKDENWAEKRKILYMKQMNYFVSKVKLVERAVEINDDSELSHEEREYNLTELFKEYNVKLIFIGRYQDSRLEF